MTEKAGPRAANRKANSENGLIRQVARTFARTFAPNARPMPKAADAHPWVRDVDRWFLENVVPHERGFLSLARRMSGDVEAARDLVHDVYAEILADAKWQTITHPRAYVRRTIYNLGVNRLKRSRIVTMQQLARVETVSYADLNPDAFDALSSREELELVLAALRKLPPRSRRALVLRRMEGMPPREIAASMGVSVSTVETHLANGLALLSDLLDISQAGAEANRSRKRKAVRGDHTKSPVAGGE